MRHYELLDDRQAQSEAAVSARRRRVGLLEWLKEAQQEGRIDSLAGVADTKNDARAAACRCDIDPPSARSELNGVR